MELQYIWKNVFYSDFFAFFVRTMVSFKVKFCKQYLVQLHDWLHHHVGGGQRNLALPWESLGNLGGKSRKSVHWSLGAIVGKVGQGSRFLARWKERERHAVLGQREWKDGREWECEAGSIIDVKKKCNSLWMEHIAPQLSLWWHQFWMLDIHAK